MGEILTLLNLVETNLRQGQRVSAQKQLQEFLAQNSRSHRSQLSKKYLAAFAEKLRRASLPEIALKLLYSSVRYKGTRYKGLQVSEHQEYAAALIALGALEEAENILINLLPKSSPKTHFLLGYSSMRQWDYEKAIDHLQNYLHDKSLPEYERWVGEVNLIASKVALAEAISDQKKLMKPLQELIAKAEQKDFKVLHVNLCEIQAQLLLKTDSLNLSKADTEKVQELIHEPKSRENLYIQNWYWIARRPKDLQESAQTKSWIKSMIELQEQAALIGHSEIIRNIDFYLVPYKFELINKLYYGTSFPSYRKRILTTFKKDLAPFYWHTLETSSAALNPTNLLPYSFDYREFKDYPSNSLVHRVLTALMADFYKKQNKYALFYKIFPQEHLNPYTSFNKLHQAFHRTKDWLKKHKIPFDIVEEQSNYSLQGYGKIKIYLEDLDLPTHSDHKIQSMFEKVKSHFGHSAFTSEQLLSCLPLGNPRAAQRWLTKVLHLNLMRKYREGRNIFYQII